MRTQMTVRVFRLGGWLLLLLLGCVGLFLSDAAKAAESESFSNPAVTARLISAEDGIAAGAASVSLGLVLEYGEGWKGYWRTPGEVGLAPEIDWTGSTNLKSAELLWPAPERFEAFGNQRSSFFPPYDECTCVMVCLLTGSSLPMRCR